MSFADVYSKDCSKFIEKKNGLSYLSWAEAWREFKLFYPNATYEVVKFNGLPYVFDPRTGYMVYTTVTADELTYEMWLPVMDSSNRAMLDKPYTYKVKNKNFKWATLKEDGKYYDKYGNEQTEYIIYPVDAATMFDINKTIMRCLTKNLAMFGLGLSIYSGEDVPADISDKEPVAPPSEPPVMCTQEQIADLKIDFKKVWPSREVKELIHDWPNVPASKFDEYKKYFADKLAEKEAQ